MTLLGFKRLPKYKMFNFQSKTGCRFFALLFLQDLHLNRVVVKESAPNTPEPADPHHRHPKQVKVKSYDLSGLDKFWELHKGRCVSQS